METNCDRRIASTAAPQALMLMNSEFTLRQANRFAHRLIRDARSDPRKQVARAFEIAFARPATDAEIAESLAFLEHQSEEVKTHSATTAPAKSTPAAPKKRRRNRDDEPPHGGRSRIAAAHRFLPIPDQLQRVFVQRLNETIKKNEEKREPAG